MKAIQRPPVPVRSAPTTGLARLAGPILLGGCVGLCALNAEAADLPGVAAAFGNTVISTYPDGRSQKIWLHADGSWTGLSRGGEPLAGRWSAKNGKVCLRQSKPATLPISYCTPFPANSTPGVQWSSRDIGGTPIRLTLQQGMPAAAR